MLKQVQHDAKGGSKLYDDVEEQMFVHCTEAPLLLLKEKELEDEVAAQLTKSTSE